MKNYFTIILLKIQFLFSTNKTLFMKNVFSALGVNSSKNIREFDETEYEDYDENDLKVEVLNETESKIPSERKLTRKVDFAKSRMSSKGSKSPISSTFLGLTLILTS
jgi:hypothetical protein